EDHASRFHFGDVDVEQFEHRRRLDFARQQLLKELEAAEDAADFRVRVVVHEGSARGSTGSPRATSGACSWRRTRYRILPTPLIGSVSRISTARGTLYSVRFVRQCMRISSTVTVVSGLSAIHALTVSP